MAIGKTKNITHYVIDNSVDMGMCRIKCPVRKNFWVGSHECKHNCKHLISHDEIDQVIECDVNYNRFKDKNKRL